MLSSDKPVTVEPPSKAAQNQTHFCYILVHPTNKTYAGYTVSPARRLRQHNCEIAGGAKYTSRYQPGWEFLAIITSPQFTKHTGLSFEWSLHHPTNRRKHPKNYNGVEGRLRSLPLVFANKKFMDLQYQVYVKEAHKGKAQTLLQSFKNVFVTTLDPVDLKGLVNSDVVAHVADVLNDLSLKEKSSISDLTQKTASGEAFDKKRPCWWSKEKSFLNFVDVYGTEHLFVIADAVGDSTKKWLRSKVPASQIIHTDYKSGAFSFLFAARLASKLPGNSKILFAEDDYVWCPDSKRCLLEALEVADYATPYDHPDKYQNAGTVRENGCVGNPLISDNSEVTRLYVTESCHLKVTNSTTVTFATKAKTVKADLDLFEKYCSSGFPRDFELFRELITQRSRKLVSTVPAKATHCETAYLSPTIDWQGLITSTLIQPGFHTSG